MFNNLIYIDVILLNSVPFSSFSVFFGMGVFSPFFSTERYLKAVAKLKKIFREKHFFLLLLLTLIFTHQVKAMCEPKRRKSFAES
jgi:hypothetical protein